MDAQKQIRREQRALAQRHAKKLAPKEEAAPVEVVAEAPAADEAPVEA